jgi:DNA-binding PadR family transcriptional regulator
MVTRDPLDKFEHELRRGTVVLAALSQLASAQYGYSLRQGLASQGMEIEEGTLYPLLRRLELQGLLESEWRIENGGPPRRYYVRSQQGTRHYHKLIDSWRGMRTVVDRLILDEGVEE